MRTITLLTDFGLKDPYVGIMKGVILSINPDVMIVDITHEVEPQDIREGAFLLKEYCSFFQSETIHVAIVDPTVGSPRRPVIVSKDGQFFVGPDNGIFSLLTGSNADVYAVENRDFMLKNVSPTFHGRDIFAPVAAYLSTGMQPSVFGNMIANPVCLTDVFPDIVNDALLGEIIRFDRFGNAITNIDIEIFRDFTGGNPFRIVAAGLRFSSINRSYYEKDFTCVVGSSGYLEFGFYNGSFEAEKGVKKGDLVTVELL